MRFSEVAVIRGAVDASDCIEHFAETVVVSLAELYGIDHDGRRPWFALVLHNLPVVIESVPWYSSRSCNIKIKIGFVRKICKFVDVQSAGHANTALNECVHRQCQYGQRRPDACNAP